MSPGTRRAFAALGLALAVAALSGCRSFTKLEADDPTVTEDEVFAAAESDDPALLPHLRKIVWMHERYPTEVVVAAIVALAERRDTGSVGALTEAARCGDDELRWHALRALKQLGAGRTAKACKVPTGREVSHVHRQRR